MALLGYPHRLLRSSDECFDVTTDARTPATAVGLGSTLEFSTDPDRVVLATGEVAVTVDGVCTRGSSEARLDLVPRPRVVLDCQFDGAPPPLSVLNDPESVTDVEFEGHRIDVVLLGSTWTSDGVLRTKWCPSPQPVQVGGGDDTTMRSLRACLFNLGFYQDVDLAHGQWVVAIRTHGDTVAHQRAIRDQGLYRPTHTVDVRDTEGRSFSGVEADGVLQALGNFLSFANGGSCTLVCPSGRDENGEHVWSQWSAPIGPESVAFCWSGRRFAKPLVALFPGFMAKWADEGWRDALRTAIWWYTAANDGTAIDSGIVSAQIALERLAYEYCVRERALVSERGFDRLTAADRYRMFFASLAVPLSIPSSLTVLSSASKSEGRDWADAADAMTALRNKLVHSGKPRAPLPPGCYNEAWLLATWLVEASILALCGFQGEYWNRISRCDDRAPWTAKRTPHGQP